MRVHPEIVVRKSPDGSAVLFHSGSGEMFNMNPTATFIWDRLAEGLDRSAILAKLSEVTDPGPDAATDLDQFIADLIHRGFLSE